MQISDNGLAFIKRHEGLRLQTYLDAAGCPTVGYGHLCQSPNDYPHGVTNTQAEDLLRVDLQRFESVVSDLQRRREAGTRTRLRICQTDALLDFAFNVGVQAFRSSKVYTRAVTDHQDAPYAASEMLNWTLAGGKVMQGLVQRRMDCYWLYRFGEYTRPR